MRRRKFLTAIGAGAAVATIAKPAIAQSMPQLKWRMPASWPKSLDTLFGACTNSCEIRVGCHRRQLPDSDLRRR